MKFDELYQKVLVLDSSVIAKLFLNEKDIKKSRRILKMHKERSATIMISPLLFYELGNIFLFKLSEEGAQEAMKKTKSYSFAVVDLDLSDQKKAIKLGKKYPKTSYYDCSYHTLAKEHDAIFITADEIYFQKAKKEGNIALLQNLK